MLNLFGIHLSAAQTEHVSQMMVDAAKEPGYRYPWDGLEEEMEAKCSAEITIVGYGSLVNNASAAHTLSEESLVTFQPVIVFGARRLFNSCSCGVECPADRQDGGHCQRYRDEAAFDGNKGNTAPRSGV